MTKHFQDDDEWTLIKNRYEAILENATLSEINGNNPDIVNLMARGLGITVKDLFAKVARRELTIIDACDALYRGRES